MCFQRLPFMVRQAHHERKVKELIRHCTRETTLRVFGKTLIFTTFYGAITGHTKDASRTTSDDYLPTGTFSVRFTISIGWKTGSCDP